MSRGERIIKTKIVQQFVCVIIVLKIIYCIYLLLRTALPVVHPITNLLDQALPHSQRAWMGSEYIF